MTVHGREAKVNEPFYEDSFVKRFFQCVDERCCMEALVLLGECDGGVTPLMHPDPRPGYDKRSSQCSDDLLSVRGVFAPHLMLNALKALGQETHDYVNLSVCNVAYCGPPVEIAGR